MDMMLKGKVKADGWGFEIASDTSETDFLSSEIKSDIHKLVHNGNYNLITLLPMK